MPGKELRYYIKQEQSLQITLNNIKKFVEALGEDENFQSPKIRLEKLDEILEKFLEVRLQIELATEDAADEDGSNSLAAEESVLKRKQAENVKAIEDYENEVYRLKQLILNILPSTASVQAPILSPAVQTRKIKLPELKLPTFSGKDSDWVTFRDIYKNLIHNDSSLSDIDKFTYLRTSLTGDALQEIAPVEISSDNYYIAWKALEDLYENKKLLVTTNLNSLFALDPLRQESFESLNKLVNGFEKNKQMLKKLGEATEGWSTILQYMMCKRLHPATLKHWEAHHSSKEVPEYNDLADYLKNYCLVLQSITPAKLDTTQGDQRKLFRSSLSHPGVQPSELCPFCKESAHSAFKCTKFMKMRVAERLDVIRRNGQCLNCLGTGHLARLCTRGMCQHCGKRHHSLLHATSLASANANHQSIKKTQGQSILALQTQQKQDLNKNSTHNQLSLNRNTQSNKGDATNAIITHHHTPLLQFTWDNED